MELAIVERDVDVDQWESECTAKCERLFNTAFDCRNELSRNRSADDAIFEYKSRAALERLDAKVNDTELAVSAALLLIPALGLGGLADRLAEGQFDRFAINFNGELASESLQYDLQMEVTHTGQH